MRNLIALGSLLVISLHHPAAASTLDQQMGWGAWFNTAKLSERWSLVSDTQLRSSDGWERPRNLILRGGASYAFAPAVSLAAGYAYIDTYTPKAPALTEHRSWQQLVFQQKPAGLPLTHRLRLEQRFIERASGDDLYSDRLRYFARLQIPMADSGKAGFARGSYVALQNEVFLHLSARSKLNGRLFDQNRAYAGVGFRVSPQLDVEAGYLNQLLNGRGVDTENHVVLLSLYSRF